MERSEEFFKSLEILILKEQLLSEIVVWLKARGLYEDAAKDISLLPSAIKVDTKMEIVK